MAQDELMDELADETEDSYEAFFQFGDFDPVKFATVKGGHTFSITLDASATEYPEINFTDGNGNQFKMLLKKCL